jgi:hypothetical protein
MRIVKTSTPSQLVLRDRTLWISGVCFAGALVLGYRVLALHDPAGIAISALLLLGFGLVFFGATDVVFDRTAQVCRLRRISALGVVRASYRFPEIADVKVEIEPSLGHSATTMCRLALVTAAGTTPLTRSYEPSLSRYNAMRDAIVLALAADLPLSAEIDPVRDLVKQGRRIDAIALLRRRDKLGLTEAHERVARLEREVAAAS